MYYKICNSNRNVKTSDIYVKINSKFTWMNYIDLNIIPYEIYDLMGCVLCGIKTVFLPNFLTRI